MLFWDALVEASDNVAYRLAFNTLQRSWDGLRDLLRAPLAAELCNHAGHRAICNAIEAQDHELAEQAARRLLRAGEEGMVVALDRLTTPSPQEA